MSSYHSNQFSDFQPTIANITSQSNIEQAAESSTAVNNNNPVTFVHDDIHSNQHYGAMMVQYPQSQQTTFQHTSTPIVQDNFATNSPIQPVHPIAFFYQPPNDLYSSYYHIECKEISFDIVIQLLNEFNGNVSNINFNRHEYIFFYQQQVNNRVYQVVCKIVPPSLITHFLNKYIYGIETEPVIGQEQPTFAFDQKENLKIFLTQYLSHLLN